MGKQTDQDFVCYFERLQTASGGEIKRVWLMGLEAEVTENKVLLKMKKTYGLHYQEFKGDILEVFDAEGELMVTIHYP